MRGAAGAGLASAPILAPAWTGTRAPPVILLFENRGSDLGERLARRLGERARRLALDAAQRGEAIVVGDWGVRWQGCDLEGAALAWLETPAFAWPQPRLEGEAGRGGASREARALALSALHALAARTPCVNPLGAGALAAAPLVALDRLAARGVEVAPWELAPRAEDDAAAPWRDPLGRVAGHEPRPPAPGRPAWRSLTRGERWTCLVAGDALAGATRAGELRTAREVPADLAAQAVAAARALELVQAEVEVVATDAGPRVAWLGAGPDLGDWDRRLEGGVERALVEWMDTRLACPATAGDRA